MTAGRRAQAGSPGPLSDVRGAGARALSGTGGHNTMGTRALVMSIGPLSHKWLLIMLNIAHEEWIGGVLISRQPTGP